MDHPQTLLSFIPKARRVATTLPHPRYSPLYPSGIANYPPNPGLVLALATGIAYYPSEPWVSASVSLRDSLLPSRTLGKC